MISMKHFKRILWTHVLVDNNRYDLMEAVKKFQYDHPKMKIIDIKYNHAMCLSGNSSNSTIIEKYSAMIIYK